MKVPDESYRLYRFVELDAPGVTYIVVLEKCENFPREEETSFSEVKLPARHQWVRKINFRPRQEKEGVDTIQPSEVYQLCDVERRSLQCKCVIFLQANEARRANRRRSTRRQFCVVV